MLKMAKLPKTFWGDTVQTSCLEFDILERVWTRKEVSFSYLKVFECKTFAHVPKEQRAKLDDKAVPCIFLGYGDAEFGYRLWNPEHKMLIRSRDVVFHENETIEQVQKTGESTFITPDLTTDSSTKNATNTRDIQDWHDHHDESEIDGDTEGVEQGEQPPTLGISTACREKNIEGASTIIELSKFRVLVDH